VDGAAVRLYRLCAGADGERVGTTVSIETEQGTRHLVSITYRIDQTSNGTDQSGNVTFVQATATGYASGTAVYAAERAGHGLPNTTVVTVVGRDGITSTVGIAGGSGVVKTTVTRPAGRRRSTPTARGATVSGTAPTRTRVARLVFYRQAGWPCVSAALMH
jgi:hypothetical protein